MLKCSLYKKLLHFTIRFSIFQFHKQIPFEQLNKFQNRVNLKNIFIYYSFFFFFVFSNLKENNVLLNYATTNS